MKRQPLISLLVILAALVVGCAPSSPNETAAQKGMLTSEDSAVIGPDALVQFSLLAALAAGDYGDGIPLSEVRKHGDFGLGTFDRLDGEMIVLEGEVYQVLADGTVRRRDDEGLTPFATVTFFSADGQFDNVSIGSLSELDQWLNRRLPNAQIPVAVRVQGDFEGLTLRSAPPQTPPYRPLVAVIDQQVTWQRRNVHGTLIGFRCPEWMGTLNVAGYHWHFISDDRTTGGHALDCRFSGATAAYDECATVVIHLPESESFSKVDMTEVSQADVDRIERQRKSN
jgi:acetolactate decarboxylase